MASLHQDVRALQTAQVAAEAEYNRVLGRNREVRRGNGSPKSHQEKIMLIVSCFSLTCSPSRARVAGGV